jgi:hypothetical protein
MRIKEFSELKIINYLINWVLILKILKILKILIQTENSKILFILISRKRPSNSKISENS